MGHWLGDGGIDLLRGSGRLAGPCAVEVHGVPEAGEWLQQVTLAIRARIPLDILRDTIQPFPAFSEIYLDALKALHGEIATVRAVAEVTS